jgi:hypothetical protein
MGGRGLMPRRDYSGNLLIQAPTAEFLEKKLGWTSVFAQDEEDFGPDNLKAGAVFALQTANRGQTATADAKHKSWCWRGGETRW